MIFSYLLLMIGTYLGVFFGFILSMLAVEELNEIMHKLEYTRTILILGILSLVTYSFLGYKILFFIIMMMFIVLLFFAFIKNDALNNALYWFSIFFNIFIAMMFYICYISPQKDITAIGLSIILIIHIITSTIFCNKYFNSKRINTFENMGRRLNISKLFFRVGYSQISFVIASLAFAVLLIFF